MVLETDITQEQLIILIKEQSQQGFNIVYKKYSNALYFVIYKVVQNSSISEDLLQDSFIKIWKHIQTYDESRGSLYTWMINIARNVSIDYIRAKNYKNQMVTDSDDVLTSNTSFYTTSTNTTTIGLRKMVDKMESKYKDIINILFFYGYTYKETAAILNVPEGTVKTRARKALEILKVAYQ